MEPSPHHLPEGEGSVIPGGCKSPLPSEEGRGEKRGTCHDLNICCNSETVPQISPSLVRVEAISQPILGKRVVGSS